MPQISSSFTTSNLGTGVDLSSSLATTYLWSDSTSGSSINVYPSVTTDYWVKVTDTNACVGFDTLRIEASDITFRVNMRTQIVDTAKGVHLAGLRFNLCEFLCLHGYEFSGRRSNKLL